MKLVAVLKYIEIRPCNRDKIVLGYQFVYHMLDI